MYDAYILLKDQYSKTMIENHQKLVLVILGSFISQIVQVGIFPLFLAQALDQLDVPLSLIGWYLGAQWLVVLLLASFVPRFTARYGLENTNKLSGCITILGLFLMQFGDERLLLLAAILVGIGLTLRWIACDTLVIKLSAKQKVGRCIGLHETLMGFGIAIGPLFFAAFSLQSVFYVSLIVMMTSTFVFILLGSDQHDASKRETLTLTKPDLRLIFIALLFAGIGGFIETASVSLFPFYFESDGFSLQNSVWFISAFGLGGTLLQLPLGMLVDTFGYRISQVVTCIIALAGILGLFISPAEFITLYVIMFFFGGAVGAFNTLAVIQAGAKFTTYKSASAMAYIAMCYTFGSVIGPVATAYMLAHFPSMSVLALYGAIIVIAALIIVLRSTQPSSS